MTTSIGKGLIAPSRLDVVEKAITTEPYFKKFINRGSARVTNRNGKVKTYHKLTVDLVTSMAQRGFDSRRMRRGQILAHGMVFLARAG
jgi:hypothetical protein